MKLTRFRSGFSLVEMIIASALVCVVMMAVVSVQSLVLKTQQKQWQMRKISSEAIYAIESMKKSMRSASVIVEPAANGVPSTRLRAYVNVNAVDTFDCANGDPDQCPDGKPVGKINPAESQSYFLYCFQQNADNQNPDLEGTLHKYTGNYPAPPSFFPFTCGKVNTDSTQKRESVISGYKNATVTYVFTRDPQNTNAVNIRYSIRYKEEVLEGYTSISIQKSLSL